MTRSWPDWDRLEQLLQEAAALPENERTAFLDTATGNDAALRHEVESLLTSAPAASSFFDRIANVALEAAAAAADAAASDPDQPESVVGRSLGRYRIDAEIGRGGMGVVYRAFDTQLRRAIALKFLPPHLSADEHAAARFLVEARAAAALDHPNVCTVYEVGETEDRRVFIAMASYEGETLKGKIARGPLPLIDAISYALQIARGLAAAHDRGIVHRDVKPGNVLVTTDGVVKLLDFGVARLPGAGDTRPGFTPGTTAYMSPEQVRGEQVDHRTDLWSLGVLWYEMLTGVRPFQGETEAAVLHGVLHGAVAPARSLRPDVPAQLESILERLLQRDVDARISDANELVRTLENPGQTVRVSVKRASRRRLPWRRTIISAIVVISVLLLAFIAVRPRFSALIRPTPTASPTIERVLVADFTDNTSDAALGEVVAHAMAFELARSPVVTVVRRNALTEVLRLMRAEPDAVLTPELAREIATREGMKVIIQGEVRTIGDGILLGAAVVSTVSGEVLHGASELARDSTEILAAILRLSGEMRKYLGESLASIESTQREWRHTTRSLEALRKQRAAWEASFRGDHARAVQLIEEALALDPEFAFAHIDLMALYQGTGSPRGAALPYLKRAFELRHQVSDYERHAIEGQYHSAITGDLQKAIAGYRAHGDVARQRGLGPAWNAAFASALVRSGDLTGAEAILKEARAHERGPASEVWLVEVLYALGRPADARRVLDQMAQRYPEFPVFQTRMQVLLFDQQYDQAHESGRQHYSNTTWADALITQAGADALRGRANEAVSHYRQLLREAESHDQLTHALTAAAAMGRVRLRTSGQQGTAELDDLLASSVLDSLDVLSRPYLEIALYYGQGGATSRAREWLARYEREYPRVYRGADRWLLHRAKAALYRAEGDPASALSEYREALHGAPAREGWLDGLFALQKLPELARIYDDLGVADSALAVYERYLSDNYLLRVNSDVFELVPVLERAAAIHEQRGDRITAAARYRRVAELWRDADPELQPRVENARRRAVLLESR